jgi:hypothetical protein
LRTHFFSSSRRLSSSGGSMVASRSSSSGLRMDVVRARSRLDVRVALRTCRMAFRCPTRSQGASSDPEDQGQDQDHQDLGHSYRPTAFHIYRGTVARCQGVARAGGPRAGRGSRGNLPREEVHLARRAEGIRLDALCRRMAASPSVKPRCTATSRAPVAST